MALDQTRFTVLGLNPNDVATFIVVLILSLPILLQWSKKGGWFLWPVETVLIGLLVGTGSRGGVLALICGLLVSGSVYWRLGGLPKNWRTWIGIGLAILLGVGAGLAIFPKGDRIATIDFSPEASAGRRLEVWSIVPDMLASAPNGWGLGKSSEAYEQWFEPVGETVELKHLLSSHLTWLVESGCPLRWAYLFLWMVAILLLAPNQSFKFSPWGVAVWTAFFVALLYNAAGKWWNWPVPFLWLIAALILRCRQKSFPIRHNWLFSALIAGAIVCLPFIILSLHPPETPVHGWEAGEMVLVGKGKPTVVILGPSKEVLGNFYGQEIRKQWAKGKVPVIVIDNPDDNQQTYLADCKLYVLSGADETTFKAWERFIVPKSNSKLVLINCRAEPDDWVKAFGRVNYCRGEYYGDPFYNEWKELSTTDPSIMITDLSGREAYVADWWPLLDAAMSR